MADLPTRTELFRRYRSAALAVPNTRISAREIDREGSDVNLVGAAVSLVGEEIVNRAARGLAGCFEDTARGDALDRVIFDRKGLPRKEAAPSIGQIQLTRPTFAAGAGTVAGGPIGSGPPSPTRIRTNQGITYVLTQPAIFGATALGPVSVEVQAELAGLEFEVAENQAWTFVDVPFDPTIVIANPVQMAGADDEELDDVYKARAKNFFATIRRGTLGAIEFGLVSTPGVASATVIEVIDLEGNPARVVQAFILDPLGRANETLAARCLLNLLEFRCAGIPVQVIPGVPQFISITFAGTEFDTSIVTDTVTSADDVRTRIVAALNNQRPGQTLLRSTILAAARSVPGFVVDDVDLTSPVAALIPATTASAIRTRKELITIA